MLNLREMAKQNKYLLGLNSVPIKTEPARPGSFLERKRAEETSRLEQEVEIAERRRYLRELGEDRHNGNGHKTFVVDPESDDVRMVESGTPQIIKIERGGNGNSSNSPDISGSVNRLLEKAIDKLGAEQEPQPQEDAISLMINPDAQSTEEMIRPVNIPGTKQPMVFVLGGGNSSKNSNNGNFTDSLDKWVMLLDKLKALAPVIGPIAREILGIPAQVPAAQQTNSPVVQFKGPDGNPFPMSIPEAIQWIEFTGEQKRKDDMHTEIKSTMQTVRESLPKFAGAIDRMMTEKKTEQKNESSSSVKCSHCGEANTIPVGTTEFACGKCKGVNEVSWDG